MLPNLLNNNEYHFTVEHKENFLDIPQPQKQLCRFQEDKKRPQNQVEFKQGGAELGKAHQNWN